MKNDKNSIKAWIVCITASLFFLYNFIQATIMDSISIYLMHDFGLNALQLANLSAAYFYGNLVCLIPAGVILDRISTKKIVCVMLGMLISGTLLFCFSTNFYMAFLGRFISGASGGFAFLCCIRLASRWFTSDKL
ncbi:MAG: MFS transporter, partial [Gammaproteobacteria bacterium]